MNAEDLYWTERLRQSSRRAMRVYARAWVDNPSHPYAPIQLMMAKYYRDRSACYVAEAVPALAERNA